LSIYTVLLVAVYSLDTRSHHQSSTPESTASNVRPFVGRSALCSSASRGSRQGRDEPPDLSPCTEPGRAVRCGASRGSR